MKYFLIIFNLILIVVSIFIDNEFYKYNGYQIYFLQFLVNFYFLFLKLKVRLNDFFLPSFFSYLFVSVNMILGGYLVPRGYGFFKNYREEVLKIEHYQLFIPYILFSLFVLALLSYIYMVKIRKNQITQISAKVKKIDTKFIFILFLLYLISLVVGLPVGVQIGFLIIIIYNILFVFKKFYFRYLFYIVILFFSLKFYSFDKRNIVVVLFLIVFYETVVLKSKPISNIKAIFSIFILGLLFMFLIISASINRGYGNYKINNFLDLITSAQDYLKQDIFIDAITDNLELNYNYGATFTALNYLENGKVNYQFGLTLIKPLFYFIPREIFSEKPQSFMQRFTEQYIPGGWKDGESLPVNFIVELYGNFHYLGLFALYFFYIFFNNMYLYIIKNLNKLNFKLYTCLFFVITHLFFIRGSGLDLYILYYLFSIPCYLIYVILNKVLILKSIKQRISKDL